MGILNYTTTISAARTGAEIQALLVRAKAQAVLCEYAADGTMSAMSFRVPTSYGVVSFRMPANTTGVLRSLCRNPKVPKRLHTKEQASNVAWRILKDWIAAQLAIVEAELAEMPEVFLAYAQRPDGRTMYETARDSSFSGLALIEGPRAPTAGAGAPGRGGAI
jgi:hypothetical protein